MAKVKVYSTPTCPWCKKVKAWLTEHKVEFTDLNVAEDDKAKEEMIDKSGQMGVPVIMIEGFKDIIVGFNEGKLKEALKLK
jgi:glutaredoxin 3